MDLIEVVLNEPNVLKEINDAVEKECPEEVKFIDGLVAVGVDDGPWNNIQSVIGSSIRKGFEMGFKMGQQIAGREKPLSVKWADYD